MLSSAFINLIEDGYKKDKRMLSFYEKNLKSYPSGSISIKKINNKVYCYLNKRIGNVIKSSYYSCKEKDINELKSKLQERKRILRQIKILKLEIKDLNNILRRYNSEKIRQRRRLLEFN